MTKQFVDIARIAMQPSLLPHKVIAHIQQSNHKTSIFIISTTMNNHPPLIQIYHQKKLGLLNFAGKTVLPIAYQTYTPQSEGYIGIKQGDKWGFWNLTTNQLDIPLEFEEVKFFREELAPVKQAGKWGYINKKKEWVIPPQYDYVHAFSEGLAAIKAGDKWGFINKKGEWVIAPTLDLVRRFEQGVAVIFKIIESYLEYDEGGSYPAVRGTYGLIDKQGEVLLPPIYEAIGKFKEGLAKITLEGKQGIINTKGQLVIPIQYEEVGEFSEGLVAVRQGRKWGYINIKGEIVIAPQFEEAQAFQDGWAVVRLGRKSTARIITYNKEEGRKPSYEEEREEGYNLIDKKGILQFPHHHWSIHRSKEGIIIIHNYEAAGAYDKALNLQLPHQYEHLGYYGAGYFVATSNNGQERKFLYQGEAWTVKGNFLILGAYQGNYLIFQGARGKEENCQVGILNYQGEWVLESNYQYASLEKSLSGQDLD